jgi:vacuolar-type H+-ATPase subunit F/Vma7
MTSIKHLGIAVIGDEDLVSGLRLAGVRRYRVIEDSADSAEQVRKALGEFIDDPEVGIIVVLEEYLPHIEQMISQAKEKGASAPVVIEVPSKRGTRYEDITKYYKEYIRKFIGFDIEI